MIRLNKRNLGEIKERAGLVIPDRRLMQLPERVLQFGTGVLLRGLPDYFIDKANRANQFNGRIVVVKSTTVGSSDEYAEQDSLYTLCIRGLLHGQQVEENIIQSSISRVLNALTEWEKVLEVAVSKDLQLVISNTTEVGINFFAENIRERMPVSFPGKLLAVLFRRYETCGLGDAPGLVIIPTELITDNGQELKRIINALAVYNELGDDFIRWLNSENYFCNSLVDRIVPGKLTGGLLETTQSGLGYEDSLMIMAEEYRLWAIESDSAHVKQILSFSLADEGVVICDDISRFKELKLRLLNGSHSFTCGLAILMGFRTVKEAMADPDFYEFLSGLMNGEIVPSIVSTEISEQEALIFSGQVIERFLNPYLDHQWEHITAQYSLKMRMRVFSLVREYTLRKKQVPVHMARGFAAYILLMVSAAKAGGNFIHPSGDLRIVIKDQFLSEFLDLPAGYPELVERVINNKTLWPDGMDSIPGFADAIVHELSGLEQNLLTKKNKTPVHE
ncbi:MAG: tagaturonate reductase [Chitinophagaceae bacterium]